MKPETQEKILQALNRLYSGMGQAMGLDGYEAVMQFLLSNIEQSGARQEIVRATVVDMGGPVDRVKGDQLHKTYAAIDNLEKARAFLAELPEPEPATLEWFLTTAKNLPIQSRENLLPFAKRLPHRAGISPSLKPEEADGICKQIRQLIASGIKTKEAQRQIAARKGLSLRTIQRIYAQRRDLRR